MKLLALLMCLLAQPRFNQEYIAPGVPMAWRGSINYGFAGKWTLAEKHSAQDALMKWKAACPKLEFVYQAQMVRKEYRGIVFQKSVDVVGKALGETTIWVAGTPYQAWIAVNVREYKFHRGDPWFVRKEKKSDVDLDRLLLHEVGHALGLAHSEVENAVMHDPFHEGQDQLKPDDIEGIRKVYE